MRWKTAPLRKINYMKIENKNHFYQHTHLDSMSTTSTASNLPEIFHPQILPFQLLVPQAQDAQNPTDQIPWSCHSFGNFQTQENCQNPHQNQFSPHFFTSFFHSCLFQKHNQKGLWKRRSFSLVWTSTCIMSICKSKHSSARDSCKCTNPRPPYKCRYCSCEEIRNDAECK